LAAILAYPELSLLTPIEYMKKNITR